MKTPKYSLVLYLFDRNICLSIDALYFLNVPHLLEPPALKKYVVKNMLDCKELMNLIHMVFREVCRIFLVQILYYYLICIFLDCLLLRDSI